MLLKVFPEKFCVLRSRKNLCIILASTFYAALHLRVGGTQTQIFAITNHWPVQDAVCFLRLKAAKNSGNYKYLLISKLSQSRKIRRANFATKRGSEIVWTSDLLGSANTRLLVINVLGWKSAPLEIRNSRPTYQADYYVSIQRDRSVN
jgi:hypothetical protein